MEQIEKALPKVRRASVGEDHIAGKTVAEDKVAFGGGKIREFAARGASVDLVKHGVLFVKRRRPSQLSAKVCTSPAARLQTLSSTTGM